VAIDDADGDGVLVGIDAPDWRCHNLLLLEVMLRWVREPQGRLVTTESRKSGSLHHRSAPADPTLDATRLTTGTKPIFCGVTAERRTGPQPPGREPHQNS
jgi:hypothetical protein